MGSTEHSRDSSSSSISNGSAYQLILEHIFSSPATYELPLRTVFAQNCEPRTRAMMPSNSSSSSNSSQSSPIMPHGPALELQRQAAADFTSSLVSHIAQLPSQPCSLPPSFIATFLRRCFSPELSLVDFPQALTGLDYLKDIETRRRREHKAALRRCGILEHTLQDNDELFAVYCKHPGLESWMQSQLRQEKNIEASYTHLYVGLRRWILINELMIQPFNKSNCLAMLNTLFPPMTASQPTSKLTPHQMKTQRDTYFKWINRVESHYAKSNTPPTKVLEPLMQHSKRQGDENAWLAVRETLDMYLRAAQRLIDEYAQVQGPDDFDMFGNRKSAGTIDAALKKKERKADSGVGFGDSSKRPSTSGSATVSDHAADADKPLPASPGRDGASITSKERSFSTLERLARELRRIKGSRSNENKEETWSHARTGSNGSNSSGSMLSRSTTRTQGPSEPAAEDRSRELLFVQKSKTLRKARSFTDVKRSMSTFGARAKDAADGEAFDEKEMKKQRWLWEQGAGKSDGLQA